MLDITQAELAAAAGVSRSHIAGIETGRVDPSIDLVWAIGDRLGLDLQLSGRAPFVVDRRRGDVVHAKCSAYTDRRMQRHGWLIASEQEVISGRAHGWIDLLAFDPISRTLVIVEIKTVLLDIGAVERQVSWYERKAMDVALRLGWRPNRVLTWLIVLASDEVERQLDIHRETLRRSFPDRAREMRAVVASGSAPARHRGLALIDPTGRRKEWLMTSRTDGRRSPSPFTDYAEAARTLSGMSRSDTRLG